MYAIHQSLARYDTPIIVSDKHQLGLELAVDTLSAGEIYRTTYQGPYGSFYASFLGVNLNVNFNEDLSGSVLEGSYYPTEELDEMMCTADISVLPITDDLTYTSNLNAGLTIPGFNILGTYPDGSHNHPSSGFLDGEAIHAGAVSGSVSLSQSETFDLFPASPTQPTLCDGAGNCFDVILENGEVISGGDPLPGYAGGYVLKGNLESIAPAENECADLYVEWHAIDGPISGSGLGDYIGVDEDGDGTDFDRVWSIEYLMATYLDPSCGYNYPIFGDVTSDLEAIGLGNCIDRVDVATEGYIFDVSHSNYGYLVTYNSEVGGSVDDSDHDFNGTDGRMIMEFIPTCIQDINVRNFMLEFVEVGGNGSCLDDVCDSNLGDVNNDSLYNVLDIVSLANCVLAENCENLEYGCAGDMNTDGLYNVLDIVNLANCVLAENCN